MAGALLVVVASHFPRVEEDNGPAFVDRHRLRSLTVLFGCSARGPGSPPPWQATAVEVRL
jgi:hypothetical protein